MATVQFISHCTERYSYIDSVYVALEGGCRWIQLRMKDADDDKRLETAMQARRLCDAYGAKLIVDDHVLLARRIGADGVHLGKNDMPVAQARCLLGGGFIVGGTANTFDDVVMHCRGGADYIGCGPFRFTTTKRNLSPVLGIDGYRNIVSRMLTAGISLPLIAIGGITSSDLPALQASGVGGVAMSGSVLRADDPVKEMNNIVNIVNKWKN